MSCCGGGYIWSYPHTHTHKKILLLLQYYYYCNIYILFLFFFPFFFFVWVIYFFVFKRAIEFLWRKPISLWRGEHVIPVDFQWRASHTVVDSHTNYCIHNQCNHHRLFGIDGSPRLASCQDESRKPGNISLCSLEAFSYLFVWFYWTLA